MHVVFRALGPRIAQPAPAYSAANVLSTAAFAFPRNGVRPALCYTVTPSMPLNISPLLPSG